MAQLGVIICVTVVNGQSDLTMTVIYWFFLPFKEGIHEKPTC